MLQAPLLHQPAEKHYRFPDSPSPRSYRTFPGNSFLEKGEELIQGPLPHRSTRRAGGLRGCFHDASTDTILTIGLAATLWTATGLMCYAQIEALIFPVQPSPGSWTIVNNIGYLLGSFSTIVGVALGVSTARWSLHKSGTPCRHSLPSASWWNSRLNIIAIGVLTSMATSLVVSKALIPTLGVYVRTTEGDSLRDYATILRPQTIHAGTRIDAAIGTRLLETSGYASGEIHQEMIKKMSVYAVEVGSSSRLYTEGCIPVISPQASCTIEFDPVSVVKQDGDLFYTDKCHTPTTSPHNVTGKTVHFNQCRLSDGSSEVYYTLFGELSDAVGSYLATQLHCRLSAEEADVCVRIDEPDVSVEQAEYRLVSRPARDISLTVSLTSSVIDKLSRLSYTDGPDSLLTSIMNHVKKGDVQPFESMLEAEMIASAQSKTFKHSALPQSSDRGSIRLREEIDYRIVFRAYGWPRDGRGIARLSTLAGLSIITTVLAILGALSRRLGSDVSPGSQANFLESGSGDQSNKVSQKLDAKASSQSDKQ